MKKVLNFAIILVLSFSLMSFGLVSNPKHSEKTSVVKTSNSLRISQQKVINLNIDDTMVEDLENEKPETDSMLSVISSFFKTFFSLLSKFFKL